MEKDLSKAQQRVIDALNQPGAYLMPPYDYAGKRTGYVTTGGLKGWICPVSLSTLKVLEREGIVKNINGNYALLKHLDNGDKNG